MGDDDPQPPAPPRLPPAGDAPEGRPDRWDDDAVDPEYPDLDGLRLETTTVSLPRARTASVLRCRLTDCRLELPEDTPLAIQDAVLVGLDLTGVRLESARRVRFERCRLGGLDAGDASWRDVVVEESVCDLGSWRGARVERMVLRGGRADGLDLTGAHLHDVVVTDVALGDVLLDGARAERVDLTGADLRGVTQVTQLRGCTISPAQAVELAPRLARAAGLHVARPS